MPNTKNITINDKNITIKELKVKHILKFWDKITLGDMSLSVFKDILSDVLPVCAPELTIADLHEMAPSEIRVILDTFREVNSDFFAVVRLEDAGKLLTELKTAFVKDLSDLFAGLSNPAIPTSGNTDTDFSAPQSRSTEKQHPTGSKKSLQP